MRAPHRRRAARTLLGRAALGSCFSLLLLGPGCEAPSDPHPPRDPAPPLEPRAEAREPAPPPPWTPGERALIALSVDPLGRISQDGARLLYVYPVLEDARRKFGPGVAVALEVAPQTPWREVDAVLEACRQAKLDNLHWRVAADPRPAIAWRLYPKGRTSPRAGVVTIGWDRTREQPLQRWEPLPGLLEPYDPDPPTRSLTRAELVREVRVSRAQRVYLAIHPQVPFAEVFDTAEALHDTGTLLCFE